MNELERGYVVYKYGLKGIKRLLASEQFHIRLPIYSPITLLHEDTDTNLTTSIETIEVYRPELLEIEKQLEVYEAIKVLLTKVEGVTHVEE